MNPPSSEWLFSVIAIPLLMNVVTGIYTGFLVGRIVMFRQEIQRARQRITTLFDRWHRMVGAEKWADAAGEVTWLFYDIAQALRYEHMQPRAASDLTKISIGVQEGMIAIWNSQRADIAKRVPPDESTMRHTKIVRRLMDLALVDIDRIRPDWKVVILGSWAGGSEDKGTVV